MGSRMCPHCVDVDRGGSGQQGGVTLPFICRQVVKIALRAVSTRGEQYCCSYHDGMTQGSNCFLVRNIALIPHKKTRAQRSASVEEKTFS